VSWETTVPSVGEVQILDADDQVMSRFESSHPSPHHEVRVTGLSPDTTYRYRIQAEIPHRDEGIEPLTLMSAVDPFTTAPLDDMAFNFLFYGDSRFGAGVHRALVDLMVEDIDLHDTHVVLHAGDIVSTGYTWDLWHDRFFAPAWPLISKVPIYPTTGNHEVNQKLYYDYFDLPGNESWYQFRYGLVDFYAINTNVDFSPGSEQYLWLDKVMSEGEAPWKIALFHHPPFACANGRKSEGGEVRQLLVPLLEKHGVDLALLGHDHVYGRSREINGVTYVISGGGGSPLYNSSTDANMVFCEKKYNYTRFHVTESAIRWVAIDEKGDLIDEFTIFQ
jgi:predicted phosphodiesterase